jgi:hypothetical protein
MQWLADLLLDAGCAPLMNKVNFLQHADLSFTPKK